MNTPSKLRAAVVLGKQHIRYWQKEAIDECAALVDIKLVLQCQNTEVKKNFFKHLFYFILNLVCLRSNQTKKVSFKPPQAEFIEFDSVCSGGWQSFPPEVLQKIKDHDIEVVVKFGMNLLTIPEDFTAKFGVLSFHHGNPLEYRGRPAGFYELLHNAKAVGIIVQKLNNKLDGGDICASALSKIYPWSYEKTAINFYKNSKYLLKRAIQNVMDGNCIKNKASGKNYKLPGNSQVVIFALKLLKRKMERAFYGAFFEKKWNILVLENKVDFENDGEQILSLHAGKTAIIDSRYAFYADPFFSQTKNELYVEALNKKSRLGEICVLDAETMRLKRVALRGGHASYPQPILINEDEHLFPEVANFTCPSLINIEPSKKEFKKFIPLAGLEELRLVDATYFFYNQNHFVFASDAKNPLDNLRLFVGKSILGTYFEHPKSPIVIDPSCARMAGAILSYRGSLYRLGQDNSFGYGGKVTLCKILALDPENYHEIKIKQISFGREALGPHTVNFFDHKMVVDFYSQKFSLMAGYHRLISKFYK